VATGLGARRARDRVKQEFDHKVFIKFVHENPRFHLDMRMGPASSIPKIFFSHVIELLNAHTAVQSLAVSWYIYFSSIGSYLLNLSSFAAVEE
jgi:hypothetical protein